MLLLRFTCKVIKVTCMKSFPGGQLVKNPPTDEGDLGSIPGSGRSPGDGNGSPLQYFGLEDSMAWIVPWGRKESDTTERLSLSIETAMA